MRHRLPGSSILGPVSDLATVALLLAPLVVAAAITAGLVALAGRVMAWSWYLALVLSPVIYVVWLWVFLVLSGLIVGAIGRRHPKPRFRAIPGQTHVRAVLKDDLGVITAIVCYRRLALVQGLPFIHVISAMPLFFRTVLRAYSPSATIGHGGVSWGVIYDPDLTSIGDQVVIGGGAVVVAHSLSMRPDGGLVYVSAPIRIGNRATIGGESRVGLGCTIEDDAIVEPGAVVAALTHIPAGEVWGGNPARFRRKRDDLGPARSPADQPVASVMQPNGAYSAAPDDLRRLVISALSLDERETPADLSSDTCTVWDSLGQLAIAAAIFDRYGVTVAEDDIYKLRSLHDVDDAIQGRLVPATREHEDGVDAPVTQPGEYLPLPDDLEMLPLLDHQAATRAIAARHDPPVATTQQIPVTVAATFVAQPLAPALRLWGGVMGFDIDCRFADYDQIVQTLLDPSGPFANGLSVVNVVLARPEDLWAGNEADTTARLDQIVAALGQSVAARGASELLVGTLPPAVSAFSPLANADTAWLRHQWHTRIGGLPGVGWFDFAEVVEHIGVERARDSASESLSRAPYSPLLYQELGIALARHVRSRRRSPAKVIAVDCDNTLWGGVVGEVGLDGIELGEDGPGRAYQLFQQQLKRLKERGILLAVVSRNEEADVLEVFERHPGMVLRPADIATWSVNWRHKSENLRSLAEEMNLGLDSFVFLDDDPAVRAEVAARAPEVHVVPLPSRATGYAEALARLWLFDGAQATDVDAARTQMMQEEGRRKRESTAAASIDEFLAGLDLRVEMRPPEDTEWARVAQLTQRTNQFNLSLKRRTVEEVRALAGEEAVLVLKAADRFGDYGLVGVVFVRPPDAARSAEIDTLLMSCRALGRGVEDAFLAGMAALAAGQGATTLVAPYVEGKRNAMVLDYLRRSGFTEQGSGAWTLSIVDPPSLPAHVQFDSPLLVTTGAPGGN